MSALPAYDVLEAASIASRVPIALYAKATPGASPLPLYNGVGTGSIGGVGISRRYGYPIFLVIHHEAELVSTTAKLMEEIKLGFGRTMSRLPEVFGVSRQTLYNWMRGETPREGHQIKIQELAAAARAFSELGFRPTPLLLGRTVSDGKSLLDLIASGADGNQSARRLVRIVERGTDSRKKLEALLGDRKSAPSERDVGTQMLDEDA